MTDHMRIGELADRLGINTKTIRYYEGIELLPVPERTQSGYRVYGQADVERITFIKTAQRLGITLDEISEILTIRESGEQPCGYVRDVLRREVAEIGQRIDELTSLRDELVALECLADRLPGSGTAGCRLIDHVRQRNATEAPQGGVPGTRSARRRASPRLGS